MAPPKIQRRTLYSWVFRAQREFATMQLVVNMAIPHRINGESSGWANQPRRGQQQSNKH